LKEGTLKLSFQQLAEITFEERKPALQQKRKQNTRILPFVTQYRPSVPDLKQIQMQILNNHCLAEYSKIPLSSRTKGADPQNILVVQACHPIVIMGRKISPPYVSFPFICRLNIG